MKEVVMNDVDTDEKMAHSHVEVSEPSLDGKHDVEHGDYSGATAKSSKEEIDLVKKLDWRIMPTLWTMYFLNKLDQNAIANARLNNLEDDLGLVGTQFNTCISILYIGYLLAQIPSNFLLSSGKVRPSYYMAACMAAWATCASLMALVRNFTDLAVARFFLGFLEAPFYPGALYLLSLFYTRKEIATRVSILYAGNIFAVAVAGLIAAGVFSTLDGAHSVKGWQWLFIIEGVVTFGIAILAAFMLPDFPLTTRWLTPAQRQLAHDRIQKDTVAREDSRGTRAGVMQALRDPRLYLFCIMQNMHLSATSFNQFFPTVVKSLGFGNIVTLLLTAPPTVFAGFVGVALSLSSGRFNERTLHISGAMGAAIVGFVISCITLNMPARYISCFLFAAGTYACNSIILGWASSTLGQTPEKKAISLSTINVVSMASFIYTPYLYPSWDAPFYRIANASNASFTLVSLLCVWILRFWLQKANKDLRQRNPSETVFYAY